MPGNRRSDPFVGVGVRSDPAVGTLIESVDRCNLLVGELEVKHVEVLGHPLGFGGNDTDGYMLIGMRVQGDTLARPIAVGAPASPETVPYSIVVWFSETAGQYGTQLGEL